MLHNAIEQLQVQMTAMQNRLEQQEAEITLLKSTKRGDLAANLTPLPPCPAKEGGVGEKGSKTSRRKLLKGFAGVVAGATAVTFAPKGEAQARVDATLVGNSTANYGVYASPTTVAANPALPVGPFGVVGISDATAPVNFGSATGVFGSSSNGLGVLGMTNSSGYFVGGVYGYVSNGQAKGVVGHTNSTTDLTAGMLAISEATSGTNYGITASNQSPDGIAMRGYNNASTGDAIGVEGRTKSTEGLGVVGIGIATTGVNSGVYGQVASNGGIAVYGQATANNGLTIGVQGISLSPDGYGGYLGGGRAAVRLKPNTTAGVPTGNHLRGELRVDNTGQLYFCTTDGNPGTWVKVSRGYVAGSNVSLTNNTDGTTTIAAMAAGVSSVNGQAGAVTVRQNGANLTGAGGNVDFNDVASLNGLSGAVTLTAGANVSLTPSGNSLTISATPGSGGVSNVNNLSGAVTLAAGANISITPSGNTLNIAATVPPAPVSSVNGQTGAVNLAFSNLVFLTKPIRVALTGGGSGIAPLLSDGSTTPAGTFRNLQVTEVIIDGLSVPAGAKGIVGSLTSVGATAPGNLRLWATGAATPDVNTLNIPSKPDGTGFNLTTGITVGLSSNGKVSIGYSNSINNSTCGYNLDIAGYIL